jgi:hypothetical protein
MPIETYFICMIKPRKMWDGQGMCDSWWGLSTRGNKESATTEVKVGNVGHKGKLNKSNTMNEQKN